MNERVVGHEHAGEAMESALFAAQGGAAPGLIMFPTVMGITDLERGFARRLAGRGYSVLIADLYGKERQGLPRDECFELMGRLREDRAALRDRLLAVLEVARGEEAIESGRIAALGFCFGGQCALDLARTGAGIAGAASFHGLLDPPGLEAEAIGGSVIAFHGWDDPMVPPDMVVAFGQEMTDAGADWQLHAYGNVAHGFTNPNAHEIGIEGVRYNEIAAKRSWQAFDNWVDELFGGG